MGNTTQDPLDYFFYVIVGIMVVVLAVRYILEKRRTQSESTDSNRAQGPASSFRFPTPRLNFIPIFHYKNQSDAEEEEEEEEEEGECAVCLSAFEEGEELKRLSKCKHSFHAPCIDMWLNSHMDCPLCRSPVDLPPDSVLRPHSPEGLIRGPDLV